MPMMIRVLYAEDGTQDAELTRAHFEREAPDFHLEIVASGARCLQCLEEQSFDLLLLDNRLPDMDGLEVLAKLRAEGRTLPVVMVTGVGDEDAVVRALRAGAADYVSKSDKNYLAKLLDLLRTEVLRHRQHLVDGDGEQRAWRILYVEPNPMDVELTARHVATDVPHLQLHAVASSQEALALLTPGHAFDLVLTDLRVPGMNAQEFMREVQHRGIELPFIVITGKGDEESAVEILRLGAYDYIVKRDNYLTHLPHAIDHALHRFHLDQTTRRLNAELAALNATLEHKVEARTAELRHEIEVRMEMDRALLVRERELQDAQEVGRFGSFIMERSSDAWRGSVTLDAILGIGEDYPRTTSSWMQIVHPAHRDEMHFYLHQLIVEQQPIEKEFRIVRMNDGLVCWVLGRGKVECNSNGDPLRVVGIIQDISERKQNEEHIRWLAHFDTLTGLPNRVLLDDRIRHTLSMAQRSGTPLAVLFLDLDHFKNINDSLGHRIGDALLIEVAKRLSLAIREEDTASRLGGDEFILVLHDTDADGAAHVAEKLLGSIAQPYQIEQQDLVITPSIGIAMYPDDGEDFDTLYKCADVAMYRAKHDGRNNCRFFTTEMQALSMRRLKLENALRKALERDQLRLDYQPQVSLATGHIIGAEALLRWQHPEFGAVSPAEFIPIAEDSGLILPIGEWVLRTAVSQMKSWIDSGLVPMIMSVNLSAVQFRHENLPERITQILDEVKLSPQYLELELTEGVTMDDPLGAISIMDNLHERGIRMSIDDFGTGYSSLSYLKRFKVYKLKIDQSFVRDITDDQEDKAIVSAIISLASSLGLQTIAEGVETEGQLAFLHRQGCGEAQGYYFSKPLATNEFEKFVRAHVVVTR